MNPRHPAQAYIRQELRRQQQHVQLQGAGFIQPGFSHGTFAPFSDTFTDQQQFVQDFSSDPNVVVVPQQPGVVRHLAPAPSNVTYSSYAQVAPSVQTQLPAPVQTIPQHQPLPAPVPTVQQQIPVAVQQQQSLPQPLPVQQPQTPVPVPVQPKATVSTTVKETSKSPRRSRSATPP